MKYSLSSPSIMNKNIKFHKTINKLLLHDLKDTESKSKVLSKIQKIIKTEKSLYNKNFDFNYGKEYHIVRNHIKSFDKIQKSKKDIINYLKNENKQFKKIFQTNSKEFKTLSFNSLNKQKNLKKSLSLLINNNYENNIFIESPLLMSNNKDINVYYSNYDEHNDNVYKDKNTNIPIIDEENDESMKFIHKLISDINTRTSIKRNSFLLSRQLTNLLNKNSSNNLNEDISGRYTLKNKNKYNNFMEEILKENLETKKYNNSIKKLLNEINRSKRHSTKIMKLNKALRSTNLNIDSSFHIKINLQDKFRRRKSLGFVPTEKQYSSYSIFDKLFKGILKNKNIEKEKNVSHLESIYDDIKKIKVKFLSYKLDKKMNLNNLNYINLKKRNKILIEKEQKENKKVENLDYELLWRFHNYNKFK